MILRVDGIHTDAVHPLFFIAADSKAFSAHEVGA